MLMSTVDLARFNHSSTQADGEATILSTYPSTMPKRESNVGSQMDIKYCGLEMTYTLFPALWPILVT